MEKLNYPKIVTVENDILPHILKKDNLARTKSMSEDDSTYLHNRFCHYIYNLTMVAITLKRGIK